MAMSGATLSAMGGQNPLGNVPAAIPGFLQYFFGKSGAPYEAAEKAYLPYYKEARTQQNPFYTAGTNALPQYQDWINMMKNPSDFINTLMNKYQESPFAKFQQQQALRMAQNLGSATGLTGSTPLQLQAEQNAKNISSEDMNNWLQNVLGINTSYGTGQNELMRGGQHAADILSQLANSAGENMAGLEYNRLQGENFDRSAGWQSIGKLFGG